MADLGKKLRIKQIKSSIGYRPKAKATLKALGIKKLNHTVEQRDCPEIRGMINVIPYLLEVEEL